MSQRIDLSQFKVPVGTSQRFRCPACGGDNTFSVTNASGEYKYYCFRASCSAKGVERRGLSLSDLTTSRGGEERQPNPFTIPEDWVLPLSEIDTRILKNTHSWEAYRKRLIDIRVDPAQARIVYIYRTNGELGATGRAKKKGAKPKWYRYPGSTKYPLICGQGSEECAIVEDAASACAISSLCDGMAILGPHLTGEALGCILKYKSAVICLDPDAKAKALKFHKLLNVFIPTRVVFTPDDLKYFSPNEIREIIKTVA